MQITLTDWTNLITRLSILETQVSALKPDTPKATRRLENRDIIQIVFGILLVSAAFIGKISWAEAFANLKILMSK